MLWTLEGIDFYLVYTWSFLNHSTLHNQNMYLHYHPHCFMYFASIMLIVLYPYAIWIILLSHQLNFRKIAYGLLEHILELSPNLVPIKLLKLQVAPTEVGHPLQPMCWMSPVDPLHLELKFIWRCGKMFQLPHHSTRKISMDGQLLALQLQTMMAAAVSWWTLLTTSLLVSTA